jgi:hypothetical protein
MSALIKLPLAENQRESIKARILPTTPSVSYKPETIASDNPGEMLWPHGEKVSDVRALIIFVVELINDAQSDPNVSTVELAKLADRLEADRW